MRTERTDGGDALRLALLAVPALVVVLASRCGFGGDGLGLAAGVMLGLGLGPIQLIARQLTSRTPDS